MSHQFRVKGTFECDSAAVCGITNTSIAADSDTDGIPMDFFLVILSH